MAILDANGQPFETEVLHEPQTSSLVYLQRQISEHPAKGITPAQLNEILQQAELGFIMSQHELFVEMERFLSGLELKRTVFRSDHPSNWLVLKGTLGGDKARLLEQVRHAICTPEAAHLRPGWARGL